MLLDRSELKRFMNLYPRWGHICDKQCEPLYPGPCPIGEREENIPGRSNKDWKIRHETLPHLYWSNPETCKSWLEKRYAKDISTLGSPLLQ